jgi:Uma2 family endonuclease
VTALPEHSSEWPPAITGLLTIAEYLELGEPPFGYTELVEGRLLRSPPNGPGFSRRPDLMIVDREAVDRVDQDGDMIRADEVRVVIEIVSPGSHRTDRVEKHNEYAAAGIPRYWIVGIDEPASLVPCNLTTEFGYQNDQEVTGTFTTTDPFPIQLDLDQLR